MPFCYVKSSCIFCHPVIEPSKITVFFSDPTGAVHIVPDLKGKSKVTKLLDPSNDQTSLYELTYSTKISSSLHVEDDPLLECKGYNKEQSYNDCYQQQLGATFKKELGCVPPLLAKNSQNICDRVFNQSQDKSDKIKHLFWNTLNHYDPGPGCPSPCQQTSFSTHLQYKLPWSSQPEPPLWFIFDPVVSVTRSSFAISGQTLVTRLGGSVSSGRTLLWIWGFLMSAASLLHGVMQPGVLVRQRAN